MKENDEIGELFFEKFVNHRIEDEFYDWDEIKVRLYNRKKKTLWLWSAIAAAVTIPAIFIIINQEIENSKTVNELISEKVNEITGEKVNEITGETVDEIRYNSVFQFNYSSIDKQKEQWLISAAVRLGGSIDGLNTEKNNMLFDKSSGNEYAAVMSNNIHSLLNMSKEEFTRIKHLPPLSFGLTAQKSYGKNIGIESGLVYTLLVSEFEWEGYKSNQSLHYLGIPVNLAIYLWNINPKCKIYISGGFTVEKGVRAIYRQENFKENKTSTAYKTLRGFQWSLNGALGVNYKLGKSWGLYLEPKIGYSFQCNQPISIRTEYPVYFGINLGLNYEF